MWRHGNRWGGLRTAPTGKITVGRFTNRPDRKITVGWFTHRRDRKSRLGGSRTAVTEKSRGGGSRTAVTENHVVAVHAPPRCDMVIDCSWLLHAIGERNA